MCPTLPHYFFSLVKQPTFAENVCISQANIISTQICKNNQKYDHKAKNYAPKIYEHKSQMNFPTPE